SRGGSERRVVLIGEAIGSPPVRYFASAGYPPKSRLVVELTPRGLCDTHPCCRTIQRRGRRGTFERDDDVEAIRRNTSSAVAGRCRGRACARRLAAPTRGLCAAWCRACRRAGECRSRRAYGRKAGLWSVFSSRAGFRSGRGLQMAARALFRGGALPLLPPRSARKRRLLSCMKTLLRLV